MSVQTYIDNFRAGKKQSDRYGSNYYVISGKFSDALIYVDWRKDDGSLLALRSMFNGKWITLSDINSFVSRGETFSIHPDVLLNTIPSRELLYLDRSAIQYKILSASATDILLDTGTSRILLGGSSNEVSHSQTLRGWQTTRTVIEYTIPTVIQSIEDLKGKYKDWIILGSGCVLAPTDKTFDVSSWDAILRPKLGDTKNFYRTLVSDRARSLTDALIKVLPPTLSPRTFVPGELIEENGRIYVRGDCMKLQKRFNLKVWHEIKSFLG